MKIKNSLQGDKSNKITLFHCLLYFLSSKLFAFILAGVNHNFSLVFAVHLFVS